MKCQHWELVRIRTHLNIGILKSASDGQQTIREVCTRLQPVDASWIPDYWIIINWSTLERIVKFYLLIWESHFCPLGGASWAEICSLNWVMLAASLLCFSLWVNKYLPECDINFGGRKVLQAKSFWALLRFSNWLLVAAIKKVWSRIFAKNDPIFKANFWSPKWRSSQQWFL